MKAILALVIPATAALALGIGLILTFGLGTNYLPLYAAVPTSPRPMLLIKGSDGSTPVCAMGHLGQPTATESGLVGIAPSPVAVTAEWLPGENSRSCQSVLTHGGRATATALATAIDHEPAVRAGVYMCPMDDGTSVALYFSYGHAQAAEVVEVHLTGCLWIFDSGRKSRWWSGPTGVDASFSPALSALAPPSWRGYLHRSLRPVGASTRSASS